MRFNLIDAALMLVIALLIMVAVWQIHSDDMPDTICVKGVTYFDGGYGVKTPVYNPDGSFVLCNEDDDE